MIQTQARGSALIVVLWVVCLLSIMISSFAFDAHVEARITSYYRKRTKAEWLARSGIEMATLLMIKSSEVKKEKTETPESELDRWHEPAKRLSDGLAIRGLAEELGEGQIELDIVPEPARRDINILSKSKEDWERVLDVGGIPEEMWDDLYAAVENWTNPDQSVGGSDEFDDYYSRLEPPRRSKHAPFDTVDELLLVKGFNRAILYGGLIKLSEDENEEPIPVSGIIDLLTTYGGNLININVASRRVLMTLPEIDEMLADAIIEEREGWVNDDGEQESAPFKDLPDLHNRIPELPSSDVLDKYIVAGSPIEGICHRITSVGVVHGVRKQIWCVARYQNKSLTILRWREQD